MKKIIALALVIVMLFALSACGKKEEPQVVETEAPVVEVEESIQETEEPVVATPEPPIETPVGIEPDSGVYTFTSDVNGISFEYDSKYVAMQNPMGNVSIFVGTDTELPYCNVSIIEEAEAVSYLKGVAEGAAIEHEGSIVTAAGEPQKADFADREVYGVSYSYSSADVGANVACAYYAESLENGSVVVFSYTALEGETEAVESILKLAIESFTLLETL